MAKPLKFVCFSSGFVPHRIAFCITELRAGGAERCLVELATRLNRERFASEVVSLAPRPVDRARSLVPQLETAGIPVTFLNVTGLASAYSAIGALAEHWRTTPPDLVQTFLFHAGLVGRLAARRANVNKVVAGIRVAERRARWRLWADRLTSGNVECHVCVSESVAAFSREAGKLPAERLAVIPNGVDVARFDNAEPIDLQTLGLAQGRRAVVCMGRLDPQKGQRLLLKTAREWLDRSSQHDLVLVGDGPDRAELEALAAELDIAERVHFAGWRSDVPAILRACDLLVLPSQWEGMPNAVLEAMAAGLAVVAYDVEGVRELLGDAAGLQIAPASDSQVFPNSILTILTEATQREVLGAQNRHRVMAQFSLNSMVQRYERLYDTLLE